MFWGGLFGQAFGCSRDMMLSIRLVVIGGAVRALVTVRDYYRERFFAFFVNGVWIGYNVQAPVKGDIDIALPFASTGADIVSIWIEEVGDRETFNTWIPAGLAEKEDALTARSILLTWSATYSQTEVYGDAQISNIVITGAKRGVNVGEVVGMPTRGRLSYSITNVGGTYIVRWWSDRRLVAEGSRVGNGAVVCTAVNASGLTIACDIAYTADILQDVAIIDVRWPKAYQIHYSTGALVFPRTPEDIVYDQGEDDFIWLSPQLAAGSYNYNVLEIDDEGDVQTTIVTPVDSPRTLNAAPAGATIIGVTGDSTALTVNWTNGEAGCTPTVYYSTKNMNINFGQTLEPTPVPCALNATSAILTEIGDVSQTDYATDYDNMVDHFDDLVLSCNTAFAAGETGFDTAFTALVDGIAAQIDAWADVLHSRLKSARKRSAQAAELVSTTIDSVAGEGLAIDEWQGVVGTYYSNYLQFLGALLDGTNRYTLPNGAIAGGAAGGAVLGVGPAGDGFADFAGAQNATTLKAIGQPFIRSAIIRIVVRETKNGIEEHTDTEYAVEFNADTSIHAARPNAATIAALSVTGGLTLNATIGIAEENTSAAAAYVDFYVVDAGDDIDVTAPVVSGTLPTAIANYHEIEVEYEVGAAGWYRVAALARTADGSRSSTWTERLIYVSDDVPDGVQNLKARVIRGRPARV